MAKLLQPSMSGGELTPGLQGRVDLARYVISLATCRNFVTRATGGVDKRPGWYYRGSVKDPLAATRILPFIYSTSVRYLIEAGHLYFRFWFLDAAGALVQLESSPGVPYEIATPYTTAALSGVHYTQSADVMYLAHPDHRTQELRRLTVSSFELRDFNNRGGPFRPINTDGGIRVGVSAPTGVVTVQASSPIFLPGHAGSMLYLEEQDLRSTTPWEAGQKNVTVGSLRRSDGKTYKAVSLSSGGTYVLSGGVRPIHDVGRAWDGSGDVRYDGSADYSVGVEWEYVHSGFGVVSLTSYVDADTMNGLVLSRVPDSCVGVPTPGMVWTLSGDGTTLQFSIPGATSAAVGDYAVTIDGEGVQP